MNGVEVISMKLITSCFIATLLSTAAHAGDYSRVIFSDDFSADGFGKAVAGRCRDNGVLVRNIYDTFIISPPLVLTRQQVDRMVEVMDEALTDETKKRRK